jgi:CHAT domain-containing protein/tetratricopeptide (TPR) repeat protein
VRARIQQSPRSFLTGAFIAALLVLIVLLPQAFKVGLRDASLALDTAEAASGAGEREPLKPGQTASRGISSGQTHLFSFMLGPEQYLRLTLTSSGIGLRAAIYDPDGRALAQTACRFEEPLRLSWVADAAGEYTIEVGACETEPAAGNYILRTENGPVTKRDRLAAESMIVEAEKLRAEFSAEANAEAVSKYEQALRLWRTAGDRRAEAETLRDIGEVLRERGQRTAATERLLEALEANRQTGDARQQGRILNDLGYLHALMGDYLKAVSECSRALALGREEGDRHNEAQALSNIGWIHYDQGDLHKSLESQQAALLIWRELKDRRGEANSLLRTGYVDAILGETKEASDTYTRSLALFRALQDYRGQALVLAAVGHLHSMTGSKQEALDSYDQAVALSQRMEDSELMAQLSSGMAYVHYELGELEKALAYWTEALSLYRAMPDRWGESSQHLMIGMTYSAMDKEQQALEQYGAGLTIARTLGNARLESSLLREMGASYERLGRTREALSYYQKSLTLSRSGENPRSEANALNHIGRVHASLGHYRDALAYFNRALPLTRAINDRFAESSTLFNIARTERDLGLMEEARAQIESALGLIESLRANVASQDLRTSYFATVRQHYDLYIDVLMSLQGRHPSEAIAGQAFEASERARARSLLETLANSRGEIRQGVDPALLERERALQQELDVKTERQIRLLGGPHTDEEAADLAQKLEAMTSEYESVKAEIRTTSPHYAALTQPQPLSLSEIQRRVLDDRTLLLEYALGDERSYVWAVTRTSVTGYELPGRARIEDAARRLYALLTAYQPVPGETVNERQTRLARADADYWREADTLSDMILGQAAKQLAGRRLLVVADGALQYIPFGALTMPDSEAAEGVQQQTDSRPDGGSRLPLFTRHEVVSLPSASILPALQREEAERKSVDKSVAVFADPVFEKDDPRVRPTGLAQPPTGAEHVELQRSLRDVGALFGGEGVPRLMASREEANAIAAMLPSGEVLKITDFGANHAAATAPGLSRYRIIHFATHAIVNSERPELSGIILSLVNEKGERQDGFLSLRDIYNLNLPADLVVLSACNTGLGKEVKGEGLIGLTRGFMYAGAGAVVASLWKVDDEATAELMKLFYEGMFKRGLPPSAALREAQLSMWRQKRWRAPYYWAGFVIQGQYAESKGQKGDPPTRPWGLAAWCTAACAVSFTAFYTVRVRRRRARVGGRRPNQP